MRSTFIIFFSLSLLPSASFAQQKKRAPAPVAAESTKATIFPLETLKVQGNQRIPADRIIQLSGLKIGAPVVKQDFDAARLKLMASGAFESVGYEFKPSAANTGYAGVLEVV